MEGTRKNYFRSKTFGLFLKGTRKVEIKQLADGRVREEESVYYCFGELNSS